MERRAQKDTAMRYILFSWSNPPLVAIVHDFLCHLPEEVHQSSLVVTTSFSGALHFKSHGYRSVALDQIKPNLPEIRLVDNNFSYDELTDVSYFDRLLHWQHTPLDSLPVAPDMDYYCRLSVYYLAVFYPLFSVIEPTVLFTWNGMLTIPKALAVLGRHWNIPCYFMERGLLPETLSIDPQGVNYGSRIAGAQWQHNVVEDLSDAERTLLEKEAAALHAEKKSIVNMGAELSHDALRSTYGIDPSMKVVLLVLQIEKDSNIIFYSPHYKKMTDIIRDVSVALEKIDNVFLCVKPHPEDIDRLDELSASISVRGTIISDVSLYSLLEVSDVVICVNSTVGLEALLQRKQVIVLGNAIYSHKGFTHDLDRPDQLAPLIRKALRCAACSEFDVEALYLFCKYLKKHTLFKLQGDDLWQSRQIILKEIAQASARAEPQEIPCAPATRSFIMKKLEENNLFHDAMRDGCTILLHSRSYYPFLEDLASNIIHIRSRFVLYVYLFTRIIGKRCVVVEGKPCWFIRIVCRLHSWILIGKS